MSKLNIYFDNAATTMPLFSARENAFAMSCDSNRNAQGMFFSGDSGAGFFANPSSPHVLGIQAERALFAARKEMASVLGCRENEIIFTSGGTEANNLAVLGFALANKRQQPKIFASMWEHPSVVEPILFAEELGLAEAVIAPLSLSVSSPSQSQNGRNACPRLVCMSHVNSETGDIANINEWAAKLKSENSETVVFVDGVQSFCKEPVDLSNIDIFSFSGHKLHGARGVGGIFVRNGIRLVPLMRGGGQEGGIRAGTENTANILQTVDAVKKMHSSMQDNHARVLSIKNELLQLVTDLPDVFENTLQNSAKDSNEVSDFQEGFINKTSPYILNLSFSGIKGETLVHILSEKGIFTSMGAACRSRKKQKSALELMGFTQERAQSAVRFSFSHINTIEEAAITREIIVEQVNMMRRVLRRT